ncbi:MAG: MucR family transcriptional regulator [Sphingomonadaceae bacterium]|nr:MucR family transcriptional regulator [Sphingomonadaceae bacterium]
MDEQVDMTETLVTLTADIVSAHVSNNSVAVSDLAMLIQNVHGALSGLSGKSGEPEARRAVPAVSVRASIKDDHIVCLFDGQKMKMLKRHLMTEHGMTPAEYRAEFGLPGNYPMVSPNYSKQRADLAKKIGLGRQPRKTTRKRAPAKASAKS